MNLIIRSPIIYPIAPNEINWALTTKIFSYLTCVGSALLCAFLLERYTAKRVGQKNRALNLLLPTAVSAVLILISGYTMVSLKGYILFLLLLYASVSDLAVREVDDYIPIMIILTALIDTELNSLPLMLLSTVVITAPQLAVAIIKPGTYGGGDIKLMAACAFLLGFMKGLFALIVGLSLAVAVTLIVRKIRKQHASESFALVPYLSIGCFLTYLI